MKYARKSHAGVSGHPAFAYKSPKLGQIAEYREVAELRRKGLKRREIAARLQILPHRVSNICLKIGSPKPDSTALYLDALTNRAVKNAFSLDDPTISDLKAAIESDSGWRFKVLSHCGVKGAQQIEHVCSEHGIRIEPAIWRGSCAGLSVKACEAVKEAIVEQNCAGLTEKTRRIVERLLKDLVPTARTIKKLMESCPEGLARRYAQDPPFEAEMRAFYKYKIRPHRP